MVASIIIAILNFPKVFASTCNTSSTFFGLPTWYKYLPVTAGTGTNGACDFSHFVLWPPDNLLLIALAVLDMLLTLAGVIAIVFVIYGGVRYVLSQGQPENTKAAQSAIINALIGLTICILAATLVNFIGYRLGGNTAH